MAKSAETVKQWVQSGATFFASCENGKIYARYLRWGPVYSWEVNRMVECPVQGEDLEWHLSASGEDGQEGGRSEGAH